MIAQSDIDSLVAAMAKASGLGRYSFLVHIRQKEHPDDAGEERKVQADVSVYALEVWLNIYPAFFGQSPERRRQALAHELGHVLLHELTDVAGELAGSKASALTQIEERLCDHLSALILSACYEAGVDFDALGASTH